MGVIHRELLLLLAVVAVARSEVIAKKDKINGATDNFVYAEYDAADEHATAPTTMEEVLFSEDKRCPRDCMCTVSQGYRIATCNRLEVGTQKFGDDITDLVLENIEAERPIQLEEFIFKKLGLHQITTIKIVNSTINMISPSAFHGLNELYALNLSGNKLKSIHPETFANNKKLLLLTLSNNPLMFPPKGSSDYFLNASFVQELDVSNCDIQYITAKSLFKMPSLMYLNVAGNHLSDLDVDTFRNLLDLEELDLSDNDIKTIPDDIFLSNSELATLHIQRNPIDSVYGLNISDLLTLNAGQTFIQFVGPSMFNGMKYIANLNLSANGIEKIHNQAFHKLVELNYLDLSYNNLDFISSVLIKENIELDIFKISNNPSLKKLPAEGFECAAENFNIYLFDASYCGLADIPDNALSTFPVLSQINLSGNQIEKLSERVFSKNTRLVEINLADNLLKTLSSKVFAQNKDLGKLNLRGNPLMALSSEIFIYTPQLSWLDVSMGELNSLWKEEGNHPAALLNNLRFLNISNNQIKEFKHTELESIDKLSTLDISNNPLECNRDFENLMTWLTKRKVSPAASDTMVANLARDAKEDAPISTWEILMRKTCKTDLKLIEPVDPASDEEIWENIEKTDIENDSTEIGNTFDDGKVDDEVDDSDDADEDEDDEDESDEEYDNDIDMYAKMTDKDGNTEVKKIVTPPKEDAVKIKVLLEEYTDDVMYEEERFEHGRYGYLWPIVIALLAAILLLLLIGKVVMMLCSKRNARIRYNSAIIAAMHNQGRTKKDCGLVYQQLSEDLTGPKTPKLSRYAPIHNVSVQATNVSYESSPFHHNNIIPEAV